MTDKYDNLLKAIGIGIATIIIISLMTCGYVAYRYAIRIEQEFFTMP